MRSGVSPAEPHLTVPPLKPLQDPGVSGADTDGLWAGLAATPHAGSTQAPRVGNSLVEGAAPQRQACGALAFMHHRGGQGSSGVPGPGGAGGLQEGSSSV